MKGVDGQQRWLRRILGAILREPLDPLVNLLGLQGDAGPPEGGRGQRQDQRGLHLSDGLLLLLLLSLTPLTHSSDRLIMTTIIDPPESCVILYYY